MTLFRRVRVLLIAAIVGISGLEVAENFSIPVPDGIVTPAEARIGRPLTPVSVAGVARRTVRRCAVGVYYC
ncbi:MULTISPECIES: hypothetical protein [Rhizobium]|uniref:Uncharacterized protein n=1 Tax=Rhizobium laguerreae TaxID=1076926 RepID=A0A7Y2R6W7_9HYPH|nr:MULTISPECIES: hypothetical protein [Rhizobium]MBY5368088.1 hypothetical protein [Rhizobium leguminosarum]MBY5443909.1 hypothetical protein [Rhizobium leguminosarum]MBY5451374.1 hypothetical protein [Rhizobium leguminosarum]NNG69215.1 hypothetical protein [Rhizobium laguerreae]NNH58236.1 hypothetical protein [Rhizobium laguerreae]